MTIHIHIKTDVVRDESDVTKSINVTLEKHSDTSVINGTYTNDDGDLISHTYHGYVDDTILTTKSMVFTIPDDEQTDVLVGTHPHNAENELAYQALFNKWWAGLKSSDEFQTKHLELVTGE